MRDGAIRTSIRTSYLVPSQRRRAFSFWHVPLRRVEIRAPTKRGGSTDTIDLESTPFIYFGRASVKKGSLEDIPSSWFEFAETSTGTTTRNEPHFSYTVGT